MQAMIAHMQATDDIDVAGLYRYLFKKSDAIRNDLKNVKVFCRIRSQLLAGFNVPFMQYDPINRKWRYWNDFTLTGLTVWQDQIQPRDRQDNADISTDGEEEDTVDVDMADEASTTTTADQPDLSEELTQLAVAGDTAPTLPSSVAAPRNLAVPTSSHQASARAPTLESATRQSPATASATRQSPLLGVTELRCENDRNGTALHTTQYRAYSAAPHYPVPATSRKRITTRCEPLSKWEV